RPRIERLLPLFADSSATPVIVLNKSDLTDDVDGTREQIATIAPGVPVDAISARAGDGIAALERYFYGNRTIGLIGSSGVGKSTLTNALLGRAAQATQATPAPESARAQPTVYLALSL